MKKSNQKKKNKREYVRILKPKFKYFVLIFIFSIIGLIHSIQLLIKLLKYIF